MQKVAPPAKISGSDWVAKYRRYSAESGPSPGRHNKDKAPYQNEPLDHCCDDETEEVTLMWSSQVGKTNIAENTIACRAKEKPGPMMMVCARVEDAEDFSKDRLMPMIRVTPVLQEVFADEKQRASGSTILKKKILGGFLKFAGANSPASLAMRSIRDLIMDEKDRYPPSAGKEGNPAALARKRTSTFFNRKVINISSPGIKGHSEIEKDWERSDQRDYYITAPCCGEKIILKHDQLKCENEDPDTTVYICQSCDSLIDEGDKPRLMRETGIWIAAKPFTGHAGFRITEMYSPWRRWAEIMKDWIEAKKDPEKLKVFVNTSKCETWEISGEKLDWEVLYGRREAYETGKVPMGGLFLTASADIQKNRIEVEIKAWGRDKECWSVDHIVIPGMTSQDEVWKKLGDLVDSTYEHVCGEMMPIRIFAIDSGYNTQKVYDFVRKYPQNRVLAVKGMSGQLAMVSPPKQIEIERSGKKKKSGVRVWGIGGDIIKTEFFGNLAKERPTEEQRQNGEPYPSGYCHYPEYSEDFFKQLTAEILAPRKNKHGEIVHEYVKIEERNEAIDLHVYNRAAANIFGMDRFKSRHWESLEESLGVKNHREQKEVKDQPKDQPVVRKKKRQKVIIKSSGFISR